MGDADLRGRVAVITGGASGFGAVLAKEFAAAGMSIAVLDIDEERAAAIAAGLPTNAISCRVDTGDSESVTEAVAHVERELGACHVLCANVGVLQFGAVDRLSDEEWQWVMNVNVIGTARTVRGFLPLMRRSSGWRQIAITASSSALDPGARLGAYCASKSAVTAIGETLRLELAGEGIGVTVIFPAGMTTRHVESSGTARPSQLPGQVITDDDAQVMMASRDITPSFAVTPEHAARNVLADLRSNQPYIITHGPYRDRYVERRAGLDNAFDRALSS